MISLIITAYVNTICNYNAASNLLLCNNPTGYTVTAVDPSGNSRSLETSNTPEYKYIKYDIKSDEKIVVVVNI